MTTRADLRTRIRAELNDQGAAQLWPDGQLDRWILEGLRELGRDLGLEKVTSLTSVAGQAAYSLPADVVAVKRVEHPAGCFRRAVPFSGGDVSPDALSVDALRSARPTELLYDVYAGAVILSPAPPAAGEAIAVRYRGAYTEPSSDATVLDVPARDEDLVVWLVCAWALAWIGTDEAKRQRFERARGAGPAPQARELERRYRDALRQRRGPVRSSRLVIRE